MRKSVVGLLVLACFLSASLWATSLPVGGSTSAFPTIDLSQDTLLNQHCSDETNGLTAGHLCAAVFKQQNGFLDFAYQVTNTGHDPISRIWMTDFTGFDTELHFSTSTGGDSDFTITPPITNPLFADRPSGSTVEFFFLNPPIQLAVGTASSIIVIRTNATAYTSGTLNAANGTTITDAAFAPGIVPEPASMLLVGSGLVAGILRRRLRRG